MAPAQVDKLDTRPSGLDGWERRLWDDGHCVIAGTDEAGRGPLAGPVVAAAFAVLARDDKEVLELLAAVADSKALTAQQREELFERLTGPALRGRVSWAISETSVAEIDDTNILRASLTAMSRSVQSLAEPRPDLVLVDGCNRPPDLLAKGELWTRGPKDVADVAKNPKLSSFFGVRAPRPAAEDAPWRPKRVDAVIEGDGLVPSISAASILAKVHRDRVMDQLHQEFPAYGFASHKGYGTEAHMEAIRLHGVCREHRKSFAPIREALGLDVTPARPASAHINVLLGANRQASSAADSAGAAELTHTPQRPAQVRVTSVSGGPAGDGGAVDPTPAKPSRRRAKAAARTTKRELALAAAAVVAAPGTLAVCFRKVAGSGFPSTDPPTSQADATSPLKKPRAAAAKRESKSAKPAAAEVSTLAEPSAKQQAKSAQPGAKQESKSTKPADKQKSKSTELAVKQESTSTEPAAKKESKSVKSAPKRESKSTKPAAKRARTS